MTDLRIVQTNDQWDLDFDDGDFVLLDTEVGRVGQRLAFRLMTWLGESVYDTTIGVPYLDGVFGAEPVPGVVQLLLLVAAGTEGALAITGPGGVGQPSFILDDDKTLRVAIGVQVAGETDDLSLSIPPEFLL